MKKIIPTIIILFFTFSVKGQVYHPLVDTSNSWNIAEGDFVWGWSTFIFSLRGDTVISGKSYKKVYSEDYHYNPGRDTLMAFLREDALHRVYMIRFPDSYSLGETSLYDFSLSVGDTMTQISYNPATYNNLWQVTSIDTITLLNGEKRKRQLMTSENSITEYWVEGIGGEKGLIFSGTWGFVCPTAKLRCYHRNDTLLYQPTAIGCFDSNIGVSETDVNQLQLSPNPATSSITLEMPQMEGDAKVCVFNSLGEQVLKTKVHRAESEVRLDVAHLPAGLYFVKINNYLGKFVKQN